MQAYWAACFNAGLLIKLTPKGVVFSFLKILSCRPGDEVPSGGHTVHGGNQGVQD